MGSACCGVKDPKGASKIDGGSDGSSEASVEDGHSVPYVDGSSITLPQLVKPMASQKASTAIQSKAEDVKSSDG